MQFCFIENLIDMKGTEGGAGAVIVAIQIVIDIEVI